MTDLTDLLGSFEFRLERLESFARRVESVQGELFEISSVLNRKVETIDEQTQANSFLKEEIPNERARSAHPAVQSVPQVDAQASKVVA